MGGKAIAYYLGTCLLAVVTGLAMMNLIQPGVIGEWSISRLKCKPCAQTHIMRHSRFF